MSSKMTALPISALGRRGIFGGLPLRALSQRAMMMENKMNIQQALLFSMKKSNQKSLSITSMFSKRFNSTSSSSAAAAVSNNTSNITNTTTTPDILDKLPAFSSSNLDVAAASESTNYACDHIGSLAESGLVTSWLWPADFLTRALEFVYVTTGLPWWATIASVAIGIRLCMVPLYLKSSDASAKMSKIKPALDKLTEQSRLHGDDPMMVQRLTQKRMSLFRENGIKLRYMAAPILQIPFALGMFGALRKISNAEVSGLQNEGLFWFTDLSATDPYLGLQIITAATFIAFIRLGGETGQQALSKNMKLFFTFLPIASIGFTMSLSAAIIWYFAVNSLFSIFQTSLLKSSWFREKFNLAKFTPPPKNPDGSVKTQSFGDMWQQSKVEAKRKSERQASELAAKKAIHNSGLSNGKILRKAAYKKTITNY